MSAALRELLAQIAEEGAALGVLEPGWIQVGEQMRHPDAGRLTAVGFLERVHAGLRRGRAPWGNLLSRLAEAARWLAPEAPDPLYLRCARVLWLAARVQMTDPLWYYLDRGRILIRGGAEVSPLDLGRGVSEQLARLAACADVSEVFRGAVAEQRLCELLSALERLAEDVSWWEVTV